ncbi:hypothetical protein UPYG_G00060710, partial [Umbra pygmaea]
VLSIDIYHEIGLLVLSDVAIGPPFYLGTVNLYIFYKANNSHGDTLCSSYLLHEKDKKYEGGWNHFSCDHNYTCPSLEQMKQKLLLAEKTIQQLERQLKNVNKRERRAKKNLKDHISALKEKHLVTLELQK